MHENTLDLELELESCCFGLSAAGLLFFLPSCFILLGIVIITVWLICLFPRNSGLCLPLYSVHNVMSLEKGRKSRGEMDGFVLCWSQLNASFQQSRSSSVSTVGAGKYEFAVG